MPSHTPETPRPSAPNVRDTGPGPLRTARGAGRLAFEGLRAGLRLLREVPDDRERDAEPPFFWMPLLRDAGGEDVRVAMIRNVRDHITSPTCHTPCHAPRWLRTNRALSANGEAQRATAARPARSAGPAPRPRRAPAPSPGRDGSGCRAAPPVVPAGPRSRLRSRTPAGPRRPGPPAPRTH